MRGSNYGVKIALNYGYNLQMQKYSINKSQLALIKHGARRRMLIQ